MFILQPGDVVRLYEITRLLDEGQGGMSAVYEARIKSHHEVAVPGADASLRIRL